MDGDISPTIDTNKFPSDVAYRYFEEDGDDTYGSWIFKLPKSERTDSERTLLVIQARRIDEIPTDQVMFPVELREDIKIYTGHEHNWFQIGDVMLESQHRETRLEDAPLKVH
ncbi:hypothetical protein [Candidatus Absconditicoccus praedator]|uniref:hypothetical protein n=1 Tax=Candidatus Absconditicoccus praedator TaxID=2735562 RepID=UPI001E5263D1|nr:hypothetical protein [Candidatus Absconditicoccus praedator]UFX82934.1 hypothetical protein HLG78_02260 [Candidatus Absconditicoccus praedator]